MINSGVRLKNQLIRIARVTKARTSQHRTSLRTANSVKEYYRGASEITN